MTWDNPWPEVAIKSIDLIATHTNAAPFLVALTAEPGEERGENHRKHKTAEPQTKPAALMIQNKKIRWIALVITQALLAGAQAKGQDRLPAPAERYPAL